jgi:glucose-1-phosphate thymidylyltransferase
MKGVILAGGLGTRLAPLTNITNKHLLPIYDKPMIYYPMQTLVNAGIEDIMVVTGGNNAGDFLRLLGNGKEFGLKWLRYAYQEGEGGIADALGLAEHFAEREKIMVMLGDNVIEKNILESVQKFKEQESGARILLTEVDNPQDYGVAVLEGERVVKIIEKPKVPPTNLAVIGIYMYDERVFDMIRDISPSARGELEITDVNNMYIEAGDMAYDVLDGWWADSGSSIDGWFRVNQMVAEGGANKV